MKIIVRSVPIPCVWKFLMDLNLNSSAYPELYLPNPLNQTFSKHVWDGYMHIVPEITGKDSK